MQLFGRTFACLPKKVRHRQLFRVCWCRRHCKQQQLSVCLSVSSFAILVLLTISKNFFSILVLCLLLATIWSFIQHIASIGISFSIIDQNNRIPQLNSVCDLLNSLPSVYAWLFVDDALNLMDCAVWNAVLFLLFEIFDSNQCFAFLFSSISAFATHFLSALPLLPHRYLLLSYRIHFRSQPTHPNWIFFDLLFVLHDLHHPTTFVCVRIGTHPSLSFIHSLFLLFQSSSSLNCEACHTCFWYLIGA